MNTKTPDTVIALEQQLHIPCQYSAWWTARRLLQETWKKKPHIIRDTTFDLRDLPFVEAARDVSWMRPGGLTPDMIGKWVHHFDKNSQYLSSCRSVNCGIADPVHLVAGDDDTFIRSGLPGIYRVTPAPRGDHFPPIIEEGQEWVTNDVLVYVQQKGHEIMVREAWVFPNYTRILDKWAEKIWNARQALKDAHKEAYREMKNIAIVGVGSFATGKEKKKTPGWDLIHPNWWADVVGKARVNLLCNIEKYGCPVLVETDGLYYVSRDENWRTAVPGILDRMGMCGGYKHEGGFLLTEDTYNRTLNMGVGELASLFKECGGER